MKKLSKTLLAEVLIQKRKEKKLTQAQLSKITGIHRAMIGRAENEEYVPSVEQLSMKTSS